VLHLRVISPAELTDAVLEELTEECGVTHITVQRGVCIEPAGDVVQATLAREAANGVLDALRRLGIDQSGGITLENLDTVLSDAASQAEKDAPGDPDDAVVWEELIARTGEESRLNGTFLAFLSLALLIAAVGVVTNSPVTVVVRWWWARSSVRWRPWLSRWCDIAGTSRGVRLSRWCSASP